MELLRGSRGMFLLALASVAVVAAIDAALGARAVLVEFLIIGPLIAAMGVTVAGTAIVAIVATAVAIPLGAASDAFGSTEHITGLIAVVVVSALAVAIAHLRATRERSAARLEVQYGVARVLADAESVEDSAEPLLRAIAEPLGWEVGHLWVVRGEKLEPAGSWTAAGVDVSEFEEATRRLTVEPGKGFAGQVWSGGRAIFLADAVASGNFIRAEAAARSGLRDGVAFPVVASQGCLAVIELFSREARDPEPEMLQVTTALGTLIGEFMQRVLAAEAVRQEEARKSAVLASSLDGVIVIDHLGFVTEFNAAAERMFGHEAQNAIGTELAELVVPPEFRDAHRSALRRTVETGQSTLLGRRVELTGMRADGTRFPVELAVTRVAADPPLFTGTVRDITERKQAEQEREELLRLEQLASLDAREARDQLEAILSGVADAVTAQAPDGRLLFANQAAVELLGFESSEALLSAAPAEIMNRFEILDEQGRPFALEDLPGRRALMFGEKAQAVVRFRERGSGDERWSAVKAAPIRDADDSVTMAINVIEDITTHKRSELAQRFLAESSAVLGASLDPEEVLRQVADLAIPSVADWLFIDLALDGMGINRVAVAHADPARLQEAQDLYQAAPPARNAPLGVPNVLRTARAELHRDLQEELEAAPAEGPAYFRLGRALHMRSAIVAPLAARGRAFGALTLATDPGGRCFDEQDLELAEELARRCAAAIDNARLFSERAHVAHTLQQSLLPAELPDIPGIDVAARFRPNGEGNEVGGDFYDLFESGAHGWTVVMGDVCGKGPDAAAVTALARYTLRAVAGRERLPSRSLELLNEALLRQRDDRRFCTVACAHLEPSDQGARVICAVGGHPLPLLVRSHGEVEPVGSPGSLIGILPDPDIEDHSASLYAGDALVFYTDGVTEDVEGLAHLLAACAGEGADDIAARVENAALSASNGSPRDDVAVLVLRVVG